MKGGHANCMENPVCGSFRDLRGDFWSLPPLQLIITHWFHSQVAVYIPSHGTPKRCIMTCVLTKAARWGSMLVSGRVANIPLS